MRVIAGKHKGLVLFDFKGQAIRPTADRTKEAVFNILQTRFPGCICLDLFCGSGSLGIEALSRGAKEVVFVDKAKESVELTKKNLTKARESATVINCDALSYLEKAKTKFDIIFIDPPYADNVSVEAVKKIIEMDLLADDGIIVFERDKEFCGAEGCIVSDVRKYGKAVISFIKKETRCLFAGTFDPVTVGHEQVVEYALKKYDRVFVSVMNNAEKKPMFSTEDRLNMLRYVFENENRVTVDYWDGMLVDYATNKNIKFNVRGIRNEQDLQYEKTMEEYNLKVYPDMIYDYIKTDCGISSSAVRAALVGGGDCSSMINSKVLNYIKNINSKETNDK